jgi:hypothetical protein
MAAAEIEQLRSVVRNLAGACPDGPASNNCVLCLEFYDPNDKRGPHAHHKPECPYRRAVEAMKP